MVEFSTLVVYRDGVLLDKNVTASPYTDPTVLFGNTSYLYKFVSFDSNGQPSPGIYKRIYTLPDLTTLSVSSYTDTQIVLVYDGSYTNVDISRNDTSIATAVYGTTFTDTGLIGNTSYTYIVTPIGTTGNIGVDLTITQITLPNILSLSVSSVSTSQIVLDYSGNYTNVSITRNGTAISSATHITGTTFTDIGLTPNVSYTYIVTPYNSVGVVGTSSSITKKTSSTLSSLSVSSETESQIVLAYDGSYTNVSIVRDSSSSSTTIASNITGTTYTDTGLSANTSYTYIVTPNNSSGSGTSGSITQKTLPNLTSLNGSTLSTTSISLTYSGNYTNVSITRNGTSISGATNITGTTYTDTGLTPHTSYTYVVIPNNSAGAGVSSSITKGTLPILTSLSISSETASQIVLVYDGSYTNVSITRNGTAISSATNITGKTFTDTGLTGDTSYTYVVTPNNSSGSGSTLSITKCTLPNITLSVTSETTTQIVLAYSGNYTNVSITRDGSSIATHITGAGYTDMGLSPNTSYIYIVTPYNSEGNSGSTSSLTYVTLPNMISLNISSETIGQIVLGYTGNYTNVDISRNNFSISTNVTGTSYTDSSGLTANTSYTYIITPKNSVGTSGASSTITHSTLGLISTLSVISETTTEIVLGFSGNYTNVSITRGGIAIATHITGTSYTDSSGLTVNTSYTYVITPYNSDNDAGSTSSITHSTLPNIISFGIFSETASQIVLAFTGNYINVNITRDGSSIATGITTTSYTDNGLSANTSYTYIVTPKNVNGDVGTSSSAVTQQTLPNITTAVSVTSVTASQIVLAYSGNYTNVSITRNGSAIATNIVGTSYTDSSGLSANTSYTYIVIPNNSVGAGISSTITQKTLPNVTSLSVSSVTISQIVLAYTGNYTNVDISRNNSSIATNVTGTSYTDASGLSANTSYTYIVSPKNSVGTGITSTITQYTLPNITSLSVTSQTTSQIVLGYTGNYTNVSISRNGSSIATNITGTSYTDSSGLTADVSYTYIITPNNSAGSGTTITSTFYTLPSLSSTVSAGTIDSASIQLLFLSGLYSYVIVTRTNDGVTSVHISTSSYTDSGLSSSTLYSYTIVPYTETGLAGATVSFSATTATGIATLSTLTLSSKTTNQIVLAYTGIYTSVSISRNGTTIATGVTTTTYIDTGLSENTTYIYIVSPYNVYGVGTTGTITQVTLPNMTSLSISSETTTQIVLAYTGNYTNVSITRDGSSIATGVYGTSYTDTGLTVNTSHVYIVTPINSTGDSGSTATITQSTLPNVTTLSISSKTTTQIVLGFTGNYTNVSITRNGTSIATGISTSTYTDSSGLTANTSYTYIITPYNLSGNSGSTSIVTTITLSNVTSLSVSSKTDSQIILAFSGTYTNVSITRDGISMATNIIGTTYTDSSGLTANTSYVYVVTPNNSNGDAGSTTTLTLKTLSDITSLSISSETTSQIVLTYTGNYTNVSITRNGSSIATSVTGTTYTDSSGLTANTSYTYIVTPYDTSGNSGITSTITKSTLPNITSLSVSSKTDSKIVLTFLGNYTNVSITRDGSYIATGVTGTTYTDDNLIVTTSYTYIITPYNTDGSTGSTSTITQSTLPNITSLIVSSFTDTQIVLSFSGNYTNVSIIRDGSSIATGITDTSYNDVSGLSGNTSYTYIVTPYDVSGNAGITSTITQITLPNIISLSVSSFTSSQIVLGYSGNYTKVNITRDGSSIAIGITGTTYTDASGLSSNTSYTYSITPYNSSGIAGYISTITQNTLPNITSLSVFSHTDSQIVLAYSGNYTTVNITRDGSSIATDISGSTYTDSSGLSANTSYTYIFTPYDAYGDAGSTSTITQKTLTDITSLSVSSYTSSQIVLAYTGNYTNVSITRNGTSIATGITTTAYTDLSGLSGNTSYTYIVTPYDVSGNAGIISTITQNTLTNITSLSVLSYTESQIVLSYSGNYTTLDISRDGSSIITDITTDTTYTDSSGLVWDTSYVYLLTPYDASGNSGTTSTITQKTLPNIPVLTTLSVSNHTSSQIVLAFSGTYYANVSITRDGSAIATHISGTSYTDSSGLSANTSYIYVVTPYNSVNTAGNALTVTQYTLAILSSLSVSSHTDSQIVLAYTGNYTSVSITRDGSSIITGITDSNYTDSSGLIGDTYYTYVVTPNDPSGNGGSSSTITQRTLPNITSLDISGITTSQIGLIYTGNYTNVSITRDGSSIATGITGTTYTDSSGIISNTSYIYIVTPYDSSGNAGFTSTITQSALPIISSLSVSSYTGSQIELVYTGNYKTVSIARDGSSIATDIIGTTYMDTGLIGDTYYTYVITPYNLSGNIGSTSSITQMTLPNITSFDISSSETTTQIILEYTGNYTDVSISRNGTALATNITGTTYTDSSGLSANTSYIYNVTPNDSSNNISGTDSILTHVTLPILTSLDVLSKTDIQIVLEYTGNYTNVNISRNGTTIVTGVTDSTYTDTGLTGNTSYTYVVTPYNSAGISRSTSTIISVTLPNVSQG